LREQIDYAVATFAMVAAFICATTCALAGLILFLQQSLSVVAWLPLVAGPGHRSLPDIRRRNRHPPSRRMKHYAEQQRYRIQLRRNIRPYLRQNVGLGSCNDANMLWNDDQQADEANEKATVRNWVVLLAS
jgi:hypothetical protein